MGLDDIGPGGARRDTGDSTQRIARVVSGVGQGLPTNGETAPPVDWYRRQYQSTSGRSDSGIGNRPGRRAISPTVESLRNLDHITSMRSSSAVTAWVHSGGSGSGVDTIHCVPSDSKDQSAVMACVNLRYYRRACDLILEIALLNPFGVNDDPAVLPVDRVDVLTDDLRGDRTGGQTLEPRRDRMRRAGVTRTDRTMFFFSVTVTLILSGPPGRVCVLPVAE